jgi:hypothetical protein
MTKSSSKFCALVTLALFGCASQPKQLAESDIGTAQDAGHGILFGTYSRPDPASRFGEEAILFRKVGERETHKIGIRTLPFSQLTFDYTEKSEAGSLFAFSLPPGDYEIFDCYVVQDTIAGPYTHRPPQSFSIRFSVEPGKACYLGSILVVRHSGSFKIAMKGGVEFILRDKLKHDQQLFRKRYPEVQLDYADAYPMDPPQLEFFRVEPRIKSEPDEGGNSK